MTNRDSEGETLVLGSRIFQRLRAASEDKGPRNMRSSSAEVAARGGFFMGVWK